MAGAEPIGFGPQRGFADRLLEMMAPAERLRVIERILAALPTGNDVIMLPLLIVPAAPPADALIAIKDALSEQRVAM